jgi:hypothetical protein
MASDLRYNINGEFKMLNAAGKVTKSRSGFEPVTEDCLLGRIQRAHNRIRSLQHAIDDMEYLLENGEQPA